METQNSNSVNNNFKVKIVSVLFATLFMVIGILNLFLVHPVPGLFFLLLSLLYVPVGVKFIKQKFGFTIPFLVKVILGLILIWGTLAVSDLAEILGL